VRALAKENVALRAIARDSGVIASDDFVAPIGVYADCGRIGDDLLEGEALVSFTLFVEPNGTHTNVQINSRMRTHMYRRGGSGKFRPTPRLPVRVDRTVRGEPPRYRAGARAALGACPRGWPTSSGRHGASPPSATGSSNGLAEDWARALRGQGLSRADLDELWAGSSRTPCAAAGRRATASGRPRRGATRRRTSSPACGSGRGRAR